VTQKKLGGLCAKSAKLQHVEGVVVLMGYLVISDTHLTASFSGQPR